MSDDSYLWDKSGPEDVFVQRLERALEPSRVRVERAARRRPTKRRVLVSAALVAAAVLFVWLRAHPVGCDPAPRHGATHRAITIESESQHGAPTGSTLGVRDPAGRDPVANGSPVGDPSAADDVQPMEPNAGDPSLLGADGAQLKGR